jgi:hypothetical protein
VPKYVYPWQKAAQTSLVIVPPVVVLSLSERLAVSGSVQHPCSTKLPMDEGAPVGAVDVDDVVEVVVDVVDVVERVEVEALAPPTL